MEEEIEIWKDCSESERCFYKASNLGRIKSVTKSSKKERILKGVQSSRGYLRVDIDKKKIRLHHLVMYAFKGPRPEGLEIDHIDRNKLNNKANNLQYCSSSENKQNRDDYRSDILDKDPIERNKVFCKEYREANREALSERASCPCGGRYTKNNKSSHEKTKKHLKFLNNSINKDEKESISNGREFAWDGPEGL